MIYLLLFAAAGVGFTIGKIASVVRMQQWLKSLSPEDERCVRTLLKPEERWKRNAEHDISMTGH